MISERIASGRSFTKHVPGMLACSAAVGGSAPMLELIARTSGITGVKTALNGTVNFVLTDIARGRSLAESLAAARDAGFAEANASADLSGADAAAKLRIVAHRAFGVVPPEIPCEALDEPAAARISASGERWVQLSRLDMVDGTVRGSVDLVPVSRLKLDDPPAEEWNCLYLERGHANSVRCVGRGAGGAPTAEAIIADLYDVANAIRSR